MNIKLFQIYYDKSQEQYLDTSFTPYFNGKRDYPFNYEFAVFFDLIEKFDWSTADFMGAVSWKFRAKTGMCGSEFIKYINDNPGFDVYFINPFPYTCTFKNVWMQGESHHPGIIDLTESVFKSLNYPLELLTNETPPNKVGYCNYWVANKNFWQEYLNFLRPLWELCQSDHYLRSQLQIVVDDKIKAPILAFIFERMFSSYISNFRSNSKKVPLPISNKRSPLISQYLNHLNELESHASISKIDYFLLDSISLLKISLKKVGLL